MTMTRLAKTVVEPTAKNGFIFTLLGTKWGFLWPIPMYKFIFILFLFSGSLAAQIVEPVLWGIMVLPHPEGIPVNRSFNHSSASLSFWHYLKRL